MKNQDYQIILYEILIQKFYDSAQLMLITRLLVFRVHCKCLLTNYRLIIIIICYYYTWKCVKCLKVVDFEYYKQLSVFSAANSKLHSNYWYLDVKWNCILIYSKIRYINYVVIFTIENTVWVTDIGPTCRPNISA